MMKYTSALLITTVLAASSVIKEFPQNCLETEASSIDPFSTCSHALYMCCLFTNDKGNTLGRCMDHASRNNALEGSYTDDEGTKWNWNCPEVTK